MIIKYIFLLRFTKKNIFINQSFLSIITNNGCFLKLKSVIFFIIILLIISAKIEALFIKKFIFSQNYLLFYIKLLHFFHLDLIISFDLFYGIYYTKLFCIYFFSPNFKKLAFKKNNAFPNF